MAIKGDLKAQNQLVEQWYKRIYNYAYKFLGEHDLAMECTQRTFIKMNAHIGGLQESASFRAWLYIIVANCCREEYRKRKRQMHVAIDEEMHRQQWAVSKNHHNDPEQSLYHQELSEALQDAISELPEAQREVLIMKEYEGLKFKEIAVILGVSENTAKSRLYYSYKSMRSILEKKNITKAYYR